MKRPLGYRVLTGLWGLWFAAALVGPATLHACPEHAALSHSAHASAVHHADHAATAQQTNAPASNRTADADCNCLGECCSFSAVDAPNWQAERAESFVAQARVASLQNSGAPKVTRYYDQPFANGPPSAFATA